MFDDGTSWRLSAARYLMTTTTANAAAVLSHLEFLLAVVWPELRVQVTSVTDQWAAMAVAGPRSRIRGVVLGRSSGERAGVRGAIRRAQLQRTDRRQNLRRYRTCA